MAKPVIPQAICGPDAFWTPYGITGTQWKPIGSPSGGLRNHMVGHDLVSEAIGRPSGPQGWKAGFAMTWYGLELQYLIWILAIWHAGNEQIQILDMVWSHSAMVYQEMTVLCSKRLSQSLESLC